MKKIDDPQGECGAYALVRVEISKSILNSEVADNDCKRNLGLSFRNGLGSDEALIFLFPNTGNYGFWMKDMRFPIDMIWLDDTYMIVGIEKNISPSTYPEVFGEKYKAKYVIEIYAGFSDTHDVKVGDKIKIL